MRLLEICVDNFESALIAAKSGAQRLEICQDLSVGGLTPTAGFVSVIKKKVSLPIFVLIRPRPGNFMYNELETEQMIEDIKAMKQLGADGFVVGALDEYGNVDFNACQQLLAAASGFPVTFHRAFDETSDKIKALEDVIKLGFSRILTTGGAKTALQGVEELKELVLQANSRVIIMPGGDVNDRNIHEIIMTTKASEFHSSGRKVDSSSATHKSTLCCEVIVSKMREIIDQISVI